MRLVKFATILSCVNGQEAKNTAAFKAQIEKLQQERDEFQRMVIGNQVRTGCIIKSWLHLDAYCLEMPQIISNITSYLSCCKSK